MKLWRFAALQIALLASGAPAATKLDSALCAAAAKGTPAQIKALIKKGAHVEALCDDQKNHALFTAVLADKLDNISALIKAGADVNSAGGSEHSSPPLFAIKSAAAAQLLIEHGANVNGRNHQNSTPLIEAAGGAALPWVYASADEAAKIATLLIDHGAGLNDVDEDGFTALMTAVAGHGAQPFASVLLDRGADPNIRSHITNNNALGIAMNGEQIATKMGESPQDFRDYQDAIRAHGGQQ